MVFFLCKIIILGDKDAGKTSILLRYTTNTFSEKKARKTSLIYDKIMEYKNKPIKLQFCDFQDNKYLYKSAYGALLIYDVTNKKSFRNIKYWIEQLKENSTDTDICKVLIGNKCDRLEDRVITEEQGKKLAKEYNMEYIEVSTKENKNIIEAFNCLINKIFEKNIDILNDIPEKDEYFKIFAHEEDKNIIKSKQFIDWEKTNLKKYGNNAKLFKCLHKINNVYFYESYDTYIDFYYRGICPICRCNICYFCSRAENKTRVRNSGQDKVVCCAMRQLYLLLFGRRESRMYIRKQHWIDSWMLLIPGINLFFLIKTFYSILFMDLLKYNKEYNVFCVDEDDYKYFFRKKKMANLFVEFLPLLSFIIICIPFLILDTYFVIIILLLSIPSKGYSIESYYNFLDLLNNTI